MIFSVICSEAHDFKSKQKHPRSLTFLPVNTCTLNVGPDLTSARTLSHTRVSFSSSVSLKNNQYVRLLCFLSGVFPLLLLTSAFSLKNFLHQMLPLKNVKLLRLGFISGIFSLRFESLSAVFQRLYSDNGIHE